MPPRRPPASFLPSTLTVLLLALAAPSTRAAPAGTGTVAPFAGFFERHLTAADAFPVCEGILRATSNVDALEHNCSAALMRLRADTGSPTAIPTAEIVGACGALAGAVEDAIDELESARSLTRTTFLHHRGRGSVEATSSSSVSPAVCGSVLSYAGAMSAKALPALIPQSIYASACAVARGALRGDCAAVYSLAVHARIASVSPASLASRAQHACASGCRGASSVNEPEPAASHQDDGGKQVEEKSAENGKETQPTVAEEKKTIAAEEAVSEKATAAADSERPATEPAPAKPAVPVLDGPKVLEHRSFGKQGHGGAHPFLPSGASLWRPYQGAQSEEGDDE